MTLRSIALESLSQGIPVIPAESAGFYQQSCMVCFHRNGHRSGVRLIVHFADAEEPVELCWEGEIDAQLLRSFEERRATDNAACALALLLVRELTEYTAVEQSAIGTTIDYYLVFKHRAATLFDDEWPFNYADARLEVSGILRETKENSVENRINLKRQRLNREGNLPDWIVVVEFSRPWSKVVTL